MHLIVGLGNPGTQYERTRHNIGFLAVKRLAAGNAWKVETTFEAEILKTEIAGYEVYLAKPQTFMNLSGRSVDAIVRFYQIRKVIVIQDDIDLPLGIIRVRTGGGSGGHHGIASLIEAIGPEFVRVKLGVSNPKYEKDAKDFVLGRFAQDETELVENMLARVPDIVCSILMEGPENAQYRFNGT